MSNLKDEILYSKGIQYYKKNQLENLLNFLNKIKKKNINTLKALSQIYIRKNDNLNAKTVLGKILSLNKNNLFALNNLGDINKYEKNYVEAERFYLQSISHNRKFMPAFFNLASIYEDKGELKLAENYYLKVINNDKKNYAAYFNLQRLDEDLITEEIIKKIDTDLKKNQNLKNKNIAYGHFVLAKYYRKKKNIDKELNELSKGHEIFFNSDPLNQKAVDYWLKTIPKMVSKNFIFEDNNKNKNKFSNIEPILIFGIPRTGTTLVETIITSGEEKIYNAGENFILQKSLQNLQLNKKISENEKSVNIDINYLRKIIINDYMNIFSTKIRKFKFIDRTMKKFFFSEILLELLPNAKIIN